MYPRIALITTTIIIRRSTVAITFPKPILERSLKASGMFNASPKLSVFANLAFAIYWINEKIMNKITAIKIVIETEPTRLAYTSFGIISIVELATTVPLVFATV